MVICAGAWLPELLDHICLPSGFLAAFPALQVREEQIAHFRYRPEFTDPWPTFIHHNAEMMAYGLPGGRDAGFAGQKVAEFNGGRTIASASQRTGVIDREGRDRLVAHVERFYQGLVPEPYAETTCLFTSTPDEDFVIDGVDGITVVSPCSGHGAKFAPAIGRLAADVADGSSRALPQFAVGS